MGESAQWVQRTTRGWVLWLKHQVSGWEGGVGGEARKARCSQIVVG